MSQLISNALHLYIYRDWMRAFLVSGYNGVVGRSWVCGAEIVEHMEEWAEIRG